MLLLEPPFAFQPVDYRVRIAREEWERRGCAALRRAVFCDEQQIFHGDDADEWDRVALPIAASYCVLGAPEQVVGTVRIGEIEPGLWQGSRLAVHRDFRRVASLGTELIRHAVCSAHARGCRRFIAHVQEQNVPLFLRLAWRSLERVTLHGRPHHLMQADLAAYPPRAAEEVAFVAELRRAA
ncbi:MAG: GNAT family N-acetyltransferase [Betaproteobacteria bacterium]|nr:GNAT family N-acetyltransferase [Betaproteobacteria bacterium]